MYLFVLKFCSMFLRSTPFTVPRQKTTMCSSVLQYIALCFLPSSFFNSILFDFSWFSLSVVKYFKEKNIFSNVDCFLRWFVNSSWINCKINGKKSSKISPRQGRRHYEKISWNFLLNFCRKRKIFKKVSLNLFARFFWALKMQIWQNHFF